MYQPHFGSVAQRVDAIA